MKQFFKMMFASAFGAFLALMLIGIIFVISLVGIIAGVSAESTASYSPKPRESIFKISLENVMYDSVEDNPFAIITGDDKALSLRDILTSIQKAKEQNAIKGIYLDVGLFSAGTSSLDAIRRALIDFKESGKFVVAYADRYTQGGYYLASAADKVYLNPLGVVALTGLASQTTFRKGLLEKAGIEMMVFKVGTYKGAVEPYLGDKLSDANRAQITSYQSHIWKNIINGIAESRHIPASDVNRFADEGLYFADPSEAVKHGLIDELMYRSDVEKYLMEQAGQTGKRMKTLTVDKVNRIKKVTREYHNKIAVLYAEGEITESISSSPFSTQNCITEKMANELIKLKDNEDVKAVVIRVNSPGGSAYVSDQIWKQVTELKKSKPVVVSMGNVAASGGYYISCAANKIVAEKNTLTGSIGIFGIFPNVSGLFQKLALTTEVVKTNKYADLGDYSRPMNDDEKALIQGY
ncbi:MAG: signal peptide peptidase SppA, partial [Tannerella sp.]|nr:signal peptide peptidase SppA [Tannerella sp.]